jgi:hypothetical protein
MARKPDTATALAQARSTLQEIESKAGEQASKRRASLLNGVTAAEIAAVDGEIEKHKHAAQTERDRIKLLEAEAEREAGERRARERQSLIARIEKKLAERDAAGAELEQAIAKCDAAFRKIVALSRDADAAWPWPAHDRIPAMLPPGTILRAVQHEIFKRGSRPKLYGGMDAPDAGLDYPGGRSPDFQHVGLPDQIPSLTEVLRQASNFAIELLRSGKVGGAIASVSNGGSRTPTQIRLADLMRQQLELAADPEKEHEYMQVVREIAQLTEGV